MGDINGYTSNLDDSPYDSDTVLRSCVEARTGTDNLGFRV